MAEGTQHPVPGAASTSAALDLAGSRFADSLDDEMRRTAITIAGNANAGIEDSLFGEDELEERGPEWCVDCGEAIKAMNKFELWLALGSGDFSPTTRVWKVGRERWQPANEIPDLACALKLHAQTLMAAARVAHEAHEGETLDAPAEAVTPGFGEARTDDGTADPQITTRESRSSLDGTTSEPPSEPLYLVRRSAHLRSGGRRQMLAGLFGSGSVVPPVPPKVVPLVRAQRKARSPFGVVAALAAAISLCFASANTKPAPSATPGAAQIAGAFSMSDSPATTSQAAPAETSVTLAPKSLPAAATSAQPSAESPVTQPPKRVKTVSPNHKGQERAHRRGR